MPAITYRLSADKLRDIRTNAADVGKSVPAYLEPFINLAAQTKAENIAKWKKATAPATSSRSPRVSGPPSTSKRRK